MRFRSKPLAALSIVLVLAGALGGWHTPDDIDDYAPATSSHQGANHLTRVTQTQPTAPEHCALCHWLQALGKAAPVSAQVVAVESTQLARAGALVEHVRTTSRLAVPSRAPPLA